MIRFNVVNIIDTNRNKVCSTDRIIIGITINAKTTESKKRFGRFHLLLIKKIVYFSYSVFIYEQIEPSNSFI